MQVKRKSLLILFRTLPVVVLITIVAFPMFNTLLAQKQDQIKPKNRRMRSIPKAPSETNPLRRDRRRKKSKEYNNPRGDDLFTQKEGEIFAREAGGRPYRAVPTATSNLVVIGKIVKAQPFLSADNRSIYSEFTIQILEILKRERRKNVAIGSSLIADREGGSVKLPDGRVLQYAVSGLGALPIKSETYVLFLKKFARKGDYSILTAYEIRGDRVFPLHHGAGKAQYEGKDKNNLISKIERQ